MTAVAEAAAAAGSRSMDSPEEWVEVFREVWEVAATQGPDAFCDFVLPYVHPEVELVQPLSKPHHGHHGFKHEFVRPVFALFPGLRGDLEGYAVRGDEAHLLLRLTGTYGGRELCWMTHDHCTLRDGLMARRVAHFDPTPIAAATLTRPRALRDFVRHQIRIRNHGGRR